ncbi:MAG: PIN domain-containing protein [Hyphomonadaceae bacterium]
MRHGAAFTAFFDANVLYPFQLRDLVMRLALTDLFRARWSKQVHDEWIGALHRERPDIDLARLEKTRQLMDAHVRDAVVEGFEFLIPVLDLPDEKDRHVLAAAIHGRADVIVTTNLKDFPKETLLKHAIDVQHPDEFIAHLIDLEGPTVAYAAKDAIAALKNPPRSVDDYFAALERAGLQQTVSLLKAYKKLLE